MTIARHANYRASGIDWQGDVPAHWDVAPLKAHYTIVGGATPKSDQDRFWDGDIPWVTPADLSRLETPFICTSIRTITEEGLNSCAASILPPESIVLSTRAPIGSLGIAAVPLATNQGCKGLVPKVTTSSAPFLAYVLSVATEQLNVRGKGTTFLELSGDELARFKIAFPPADEQAAIAGFLDRETGKIDALAEAQRRLIDLLKEKRQATISHAVTKGLDPAARMKDSGVEWLGEVPAHWAVMPIRKVARLESGHTPSRQKAEYWVEEECVIPWFTLADVGVLRSGKVTHVSDTTHRISELGMANSAARLLPPETVFLSRTASVGFSGVMTRPMAVSQDFAAWVCGSDLSPDYLLLCLRAMRPEFRRLMMGSTHQTIYMPDIEKLSIPLPPRPEQEVIASFAFGQKALIDDLEEEAEATIRLLRERRAGLISAAATGKIDVRARASETNVVSIDNVSRASSMPSLQAVVGAYAIRELGQMGRMAVMKAGYLAEGHSKFSGLEGRYERYAAGPYDQSLISAMERGAGEICAIVTHEPRGEGKPVTYDVPKDCQPPADALSTLVGEDRAKGFLTMLSLLKDIGRDGVEAVATIYAVWNDLLAAGNPIDDDAICAGVFDWHPEKSQKFKRADLDRWLAWMRRNGFVPDGLAPRTDHQGSLFG